MVALEWHLMLLSSIVGLFLGGGIVAVIMFLCYAKKDFKSVIRKKSLDLKEYDEEAGLNLNDSQSTLFLPALKQDLEMDSITEREEFEEITCSIDYAPAKHGDIALEKGDRVRISMVFTDGLAHGMNLTTNQVGMFPISHLSSDHFDGDPASKVPIVLAKEGEGKLLFSMVEPEVALEIVTENMSAERRSQYFAPTPPANQDESTSRAAKNWSRLRTGWKNAVKGELKAGFEDWEAKRKQHAFWRMMADNYTIS